MGSVVGLYTGYTVRYITRYAAQLFAYSQGCSFPLSFCFLFFLATTQFFATQ